MRVRCWTCRRPENYCLCSKIQSIDTSIRFVFLMHPKEARRERLGTGRLAHACLPNSEIRVGADFSNDSRVNGLILDPSIEARLLYPGGEFLEDRGLDSPAATKLVLFILDGTWPAAKGMMKRSQNLQGLPRLSISPPGPSRFAFKQQPNPLCLSTIESVHQVLEEANRSGIEHNGGRQIVLIDVLEELCRQQIECARDPNRPGYRRGKYRTAEERVPSKKWKERKFFFA